MRSLLASILFCLLPLVAIAAPSISSVTGAVSDEETIVISGSSFGTKSPAAPLKYDDFASGTNGQSISGWDDYNGLPKYSTTEIRYSGTKSAHQDYSGSDTGAGIGLEGSSIPDGTTELYVSFWTWTESWGNAARNVKIMSTGTFDFSAQNFWETRIDCYPETSSGHLYAMNGTGCTGGGGYSDDWGIGDSPIADDSQWHRTTSYVRIGTSGYRDLWLDEDLLSSISGGFTNNSCELKYLLIGHYWADADSNANRYVDEVYVDITPARVEICNQSSWSAAHDGSGTDHCEIQSPSAWSATSISVTFNQGSFNTEDTAYLYVVDSSGNASAGYQVEIGSETGTPSQITGVSID